MQDLIKEFMSQRKFAVVGATDNPEKYGNQIVKNLINRGYEVYPVNPKLQRVEGLRCYPGLTDIPVKVDVVDFVVPPAATEDILKQCRDLGLNRIWLQPGSESEKAINFCNENDFKVVHSVCVMMN
jgi:predicted CoA-binding protein